MPRPAKFDDDEILERAMHVFWRRGLSGASIRDLESELDLRAPSIYRRFGSKEGLAAAVVQRYVLEVIDGRIEKHLSGQGDPVSNVMGFLVSAVTPGPEEDLLLGCLLTTIAMETDALPEPLARDVRFGLRRIDDALRAEVRRAAEEGRLADGVVADDAASTLSLVMQGLMASARAGVGGEELRRRARGAVEMVTQPSVSQKTG
ncbi:MAG: TetR/AcrR family transcriptional regulator [Acidobacteriota bacterium]